MAKESSEQRQVYRIHYEATKVALRKGAQHRWKIAAQQSKAKAARSAHIHMLRPKWRQQSLHELPKPQQQTILRLRLRIYPTKARLHLIGKIPSPNCVCGAIETIKHILIKCPPPRSTQTTNMECRSTLDSAPSYIWYHT